MASSKSRSILLAIIALIALALAGALFVTNAFARPSGTPVRVEVAEGAPFRATASALAREGVIRQPRLFRLYARLWGTDRQVKPGTYLFRPNTPWRDIVLALTGGRGLVRSVTIPEGYTLAQIAGTLATVLDLSLIHI